MTISITSISTPLGPLFLAGDDAGLQHTWFAACDQSRQPDPSWNENPAPLTRAVQQLKAYFAGELREFDLPLAPQGTDFQLKVWRGLCAIPFGSIVSYGDLARRVGCPRGARAVGQANGRNPLPVVVPCHRVVASGGGLGGFTGGLHLKRWLLDHERGNHAQQEALFDRGSRSQRRRPLAP